MEMGEKRTSLLPIYHKDLSRNLYALHVSYITMIAQLADEVHRGLTGEEFHEDELEAVSDREEDPDRQRADEIGDARKRRKRRRMIDLTGFR